MGCAIAQLIYGVRVLMGGRDEADEFEVLCWVGCGYD